MQAKLLMLIEKQRVIFLPKFLHIALQL